MNKYLNLPTTLTAVALLAGVLFAASVPAEDAAPPAQYANLLAPILASGETILGEEIVYPPGKAKVTAAIVEIPPGGSTGLHIHRVPLFAYILEGELTVDYGSKGTRTYRPGDGFLEAMDWPHNGTNRGSAAARLIAVYIGVEGIKNAETAPSAK
jgi:quercetin dioxygenase-like cupin family protein